MAVIVGKYSPGRQQVVAVPADDTLIVPCYGLPLDLLLTAQGAVNGIQVKRYPSAADDFTTSLGIGVAAGGVEDAKGYITGVQTIANGITKDLPFGAGQDAWSITPTGAAITATWTLRRTKVEDPTIQP